MSAGLDNLIRAAQDATDVRIRAYYDRLPPVITSPIEKYFAVALSEACLFLASLRPTFSPLRWGKGTPLQPEQPLRRYEIQMWAQERILDWPADFVLCTLGADGKPYIAVVECDGHDFHERTKEQAQRDRARDRAVQERGWRIVRFTGSELYRDAVELAMDSIMLGWACNLWEDVE